MTTTIDVIIPARDAAALLPDCVAAIAHQSLPPNRVYLVVSRSSDGTEAVASGLDTEWPSVSVLANPAGDRGSALNEGLRRSTAPWVAMVDAQSRLAPDYLEVAAKVGLATEAAVIGGPMRPWAPGVIGGAIAAALRSRFGVGDSRFHDTTASGPVDSVYLGVYRRSMLDAVGPYDANLLRTEDDDMNARIRAAGGVIWLEPAIGSTYLCRRDLTSLARQYSGYGLWKARFLRRRPSEVRVRHTVPALFVVAIVVATVGSLAAWPPALPLLLGVYAATALGIGLTRSGVPVASRLAFPLATATMHVAYGIGFIRGLVTR